MSKRTQVSRADLLDCLQAHGQDTLADFADALGYVRKVPVPKRQDEREDSKADGTKLPPEPDPTPVSTDEALPPAHFYRVISQRDLAPDEVVHTEPDWYRQAEPYTRAIRAEAGLQPPPQLPLMRWSRLWPFLKTVLSALHMTPAFDIPRIVARLARGQTLWHLPRRQWRTWARQCQVIFDYAETLRPFHADMTDLHRRLRRLRGMQGMTLILLPEGNPHGRCWTYQGGGTWRSIDGYPVPPPGTPVLVLSDLGCLSATPARRRQWQALGQRLHQNGCRPVALLPCLPHEWTVTLTRLFFPVSWDRAARPPRRLAAHPHQASRSRPAPAAAAERLLGLLAPAIRVEPALLRAVRYLLPAKAADVGSEAAAWNHPHVRPTALAFYYDPDAITMYRDAFAREDPVLRRQVASLIEAHHAHLSPAIGYEEQLLLADLDSLPDARAAQTFIVRLVKTIRTQGSEFADAAAAWVDRMAQRQHPQMWQRDALAAVWVAVRQRWGEAVLNPPQGLDLARVSWMLGRDAEAARYALRQRGQILRLEAADEAMSGDEWDAPGSLLAHLRLRAPYPQWCQLGEGEVNLNKDEKVLPLQGAIPLPPSARLRLRTDHEEVVIDSTPRPNWAEVISRDAQGLFVSWQSETKRAYWINPGRYPVYDRTDRELGQLPISKGHWRREAEALAQLRDGFRSPLWAEDYGLDAYGLYAGFRVSGIYQRMRWIVPGEFVMGSPENEAQRDDEESQHKVILSQGFWLADTACTEALWQAVMGNNSSGFQGDERPVETVSWEEVAQFITRLNGLSPDFDFRLPTEAEWEYACRAGTATPFWFGDQILPEQANYDGNLPYAGGAKGLYREETVEVKALPCNSWGLYQMHGNVWEWCQDWFGDYLVETVVDPTGPTEGGSRVLRGGSWFDYGQRVRSAYRSRDGPGYRYVSFGFRLARGQGASQDVPEE